MLERWRTAIGGRGRHSCCCTRSVGAGAHPDVLRPASYRTPDAPRLDPGLADTTIRTSIGITAAGNNTIVYYDHWEDGYEADISN
jgi:hypothetical protein